MSNITLIMTRKPLEEVDYYGKSGRWGRMIVVRGGKVLSGTPTSVANLPDFFSSNPFGQALGAFSGLSPFATIANAASHGLAAGFLGHSGTGRTVVKIGHTGVCLQTFGGDVEVVAAFDTLERFRTNSGNGYYVQLKPRPEKPYEIRMDISRNVKGYKDEAGEVHQGVNKTGQCLRVHGHSTKNGNGSAAGILLHEASHPGWLKGCIAPREINNKVANNEFSPSRRAMDTIFRLMGGFRDGRKAELLVMDW